MKQIEGLAVVVTTLVAFIVPFDRSPAAQFFGAKATIASLLIAGVALYYLVPWVEARGKQAALSALLAWVAFAGLHIWTVIFLPKTKEYVQGPFWNTTPLERVDALEGARNARQAFGAQVDWALFANGLSLSVAVIASAVALLALLKHSGFRGDVEKRKGD